VSAELDTPQEFPEPDPVPSVAVADPAPASKPKMVKAKRATGLPRLKKPKSRANKPRLGKPALPPGRCREYLSCRVMPHTRKMLDKLGEKNPGWAIDKLVRIAEDAQLFKIPVELI